VNSKRQAKSRAQNQTVTVPCRLEIPVRLGSNTDMTISRICEEGTVSGVYGYNSAPYYNQFQSKFEFFYVDSVHISWCPSNLRGITVSDTTAPTGCAGPWLITDDPDSYNQNGLSVSNRL
jgi:hypothetical protein